MTVALWTSKNTVN